MMMQNKSLERIKEITKRLIKFRTVRTENNVPENEKKAFKNEINGCINYVSGLLDKPIIIDRVKKYIKDDSCPILIAKFKNTVKPDLLLIGHIDVVAAEELQFSPVEKNGRIYGRGSKDMKAGVAVIIELMNYYAKQKNKPNIAAAFVSDEESGGYNGAGIIAGKMGYKPGLVITPDPGEKHCIINKEKGFIWFYLIVKGKSSHPSRPWKGECAITKTLEIWQSISSEFNKAKSEDD